MGYILYALEVSCSGLSVQVLFNGALAFEEPFGGVRFTQQKLNPWVVDGENLIAVNLAPPPGKTAPANDAEMKLLVIKGPLGKEPGPEANVVAFTWNPADHPVEAEGMTRVFEEPVPVDEGHGRWAWQDATPYAPGDDANIVALLGAAQGALANRDADTYVGYLRVLTAEMGRALGVPGPQLEAGKREVLRELFSAKDWSAPPIDPTTLRFVPSAGGRLVTVTNARGAGPIRGSGEKGEYELETTVSRLAHGWTIVR